MSVDAALKMGEVGDLLMIFGDNIPRTWKQIIYFNRAPEQVSAETGMTAEEEQPGHGIIVDEAKPDPLADATPVEDAPDVPESVLMGGIRMICDARGVRLAAEDVEDGD